MKTLYIFLLAILFSSCKEELTQSQEKLFGGRYSLSAVGVNVNELNIKPIHFKLVGTVKFNNKDIAISGYYKQDSTVNFTFYDMTKDTIYNTYEFQGKYYSYNKMSGKALIRKSQNKIIKKDIDWYAYK